MAEAVNIYEAKTQLSSLVERVARGEEIIIAKAGKPLARLVPLAPQARQPRQFGQNVLGITYIAPDFDEPLAEELFAGPIFPGKTIVKTPAKNRAKTAAK